MVAKDIFFERLNLPIREHLDPLFWPIVEVVGIYRQELYLCLQLLVLLIGFCSLFRALEFTVKNTVIYSVMCLLFVFLLTGPNIFLLKIHWFPLALSLLLISKRSFSKAQFLCLGGALYLSIICAGALAPWGVIALALGYFVFIHQELATKHERMAIKRNGLLLFAALLLAGYNIPAYPMPSYPGDARLVPVSPLTFREIPLFDYYLAPSPLLYDAYKSLLWQDALVFIAVIMLLGTIIYAQSRNIGLVFNRYLGWLIALWIIVIIEAVVSADYINLTPYHALRRIIPGIALQEMPTLILALSVCLYFPALLVKWQYCNSSWLLVAMIGFTSARLCALPFNDYKSVIAEFGISHGYQRNEYVGPSRFAAKQFGDWVLRRGIRKERDQKNLAQLHLGSDFRATLTASVNQGLVNNLVDENLKTIWRTGRQQQQGDFVEMQFSDPVEVIRVVLETKGVETDYPRGLKVSVSMDGRTYDKILDQRDWLGGLSWTDHDLPYFSHQANINIELPTQRTIKYLRLEQIAPQNRFDWSIADISLFHLVSDAKR